MSFIKQTAKAVPHVHRIRRFLINHKIRRGIRLTKANYIFRSLKNETQPMTLTAMTHIFADLKEKLRLPKNLRFHLFRHIHATLLAE